MKYFPAKNTLKQEEKGAAAAKNFHLRKFQSCYKLFPTIHIETPCSPFEHKT